MKWVSKNKPIENEILKIKPGHCWSVEDQWCPGLVYVQIVMVLMLDGDFHIKSNQ